MASLLHLFAPSARAESIQAVDIGDLRARGIQTVILDLDNTLVPWQSSEISPEVRDWVRRAKEAGMQLAVASNTHRPKRLRAICDELGIEFPIRSAKPRRGAPRKAMAAMGSRPETTAMIGDQLFTDILAGNRLGLFTILLTPISQHEFIGTRFNRIFERLVLRKLDKKGMLS